MNLWNRALITLWGRGLSVSFLVFAAGSFLIAELSDHIIPIKEVFYSWLLVFFNAYIGTFIANKALKQDPTGFLVWGMLINGFRIGIFLIVLLVIIKMDVVDNRTFAAITILGYLIFLAREIFSIHTHSLRECQREKHK
jgi:hypothetical protein